MSQHSGTGTGGGDAQAYRIVAADCAKSASAFRRQPGTREAGYARGCEVAKSRNRYSRRTALPRRRYRYRSRISRQREVLHVERLRGRRGRRLEIGIAGIAGYHRVRTCGNGSAGESRRSF